MKTIVLATALALAAAAPALAKSSDAMHHVRHHAANANALVAAPDPIGVYVDGQEVGRDPDANIRATLREEYIDRNSGGN
jgi:hypothetical protein